ncbi:MAG: MBL fold metallo-hydrolase RNA specificity domain-containing protein, partial [Pseudothermotoga sp.]|uniref:MBL fold metallo-hydrolase RNA specificity domain-containing protein n=1 Tax=Pseudothermotoga sp. TaxID=2033661 RepID=UPI0025860D80
FKLIKDNVQDTVLLNGYLAPGTLGKKLITKEVSAGAAVKYAELKAHVDLEDNRTIIEKTLSKSKLILIHHGEEPKSLNLARALKDFYPELDIKVPRVGERIIL